MRRAFTLVELLVVIGIIAVLIAILMPALAKARAAAKEVTCLSNEHQLAMGVFMFTNEHDGYLPWVVSDYPDPPPPGDPANEVDWADWLGLYDNYIPYNPNLYSGNVWTCPFSDDAPGPHWEYTERWSYQYSMNAYLTAEHYPADATHSTDYYVAGNAPGQAALDHRMRLEDAASCDTVLLGDGHLDYDTAANTGYYFVGQIDGGLSLPDAWNGYSSPWPVDLNTGRITSHNGVVNVVCVDGHGESLQGPWGTNAIYDRFRRADMVEK